MAQKKYVNLTNLQTFLDNLKDTFSALSHSHTMSDIADYIVDTSLSSTSNNPIANSAIKAQFDGVDNTIDALETSIENKADISHSHDDIYYTKSAINDMEFISVDDIDTICGVNT